MFAQESIKVDEVARELTEAREAVGSSADVARFFRSALEAYKATATVSEEEIRFDLREVPRALRDLLDGRDSLAARFELPVQGQVVHIGRTHPYVEALAAHVVDTAMDPITSPAAHRCGAIRTCQVELRTTLLLVRFRYDIVSRRGDLNYSQLAEECRIMAFEGAPDAARWLDPDRAEALIEATPDANIAPEQATGFLSKIVENYESLVPELNAEAKRRAAALLDAHRRLRAAAPSRTRSHRVDPKLPADILGIYVYLPAGTAGGSRS